MSTGPTGPTGASGIRQPNASHPLLIELQRLDPNVYAAFNHHDVAARLLNELPAKFSPSEVAVPGVQQRIWEVCGLVLKDSGRPHESLAIFWHLYEHMLAAQENTGWTHKGMPLVWMSDCFARLGFRVHAKRYLMLTLCEDSLREGGLITPSTGGIYFRIVWGHGLSDRDFHRYASEFWKLHDETPETRLFPEAVLQRVDNNWMTELPSPEEALFYRASKAYANRLFSMLGDRTGRALELLAEYLLSCMPGCRTFRRRRSSSTDYDVVCSMDGLDVDFRSELGRYFVCECKDWKKAADFTTMAKFCRILDSTKARFGILFSSEGVSGSDGTIYAAREQLKVFQDRGIVIVVIDRTDLQNVVSGADLISMLRQRYEEIRLDLQPAP